MFNHDKGKQSTSRSTLERRQRLRRATRAMKTPFNFKLWAKSRYEIITTSMFFSPMMAVLSAIVLGIALGFLDNYLTDNGFEAPSALKTSVDGARSLLSTVAGATISFAGTAFSVSLLVIQLGASQYSPRIIHTLFKDPFNRRIVALTVGTFTYCLVVIRSVDGDAQDPDTVPNISVAIAVILGILSILAIVAFIDHNAHVMDISQLLETVTRDTVAQIRTSWREEYDEDGDENKQNPTAKGQNDNGDQKPANVKGEESMAEKLEDCHVVRYRSSGWVQEVDLEALKSLVPENGFIRLHTLAGRYAIPGSAVCSVYPTPAKADPDNNTDPNQTYEETAVSELDAFDDQVLDAVMIGVSRTMRSDASYGLRQLVDVTLRALSPGVNDPTTAQDGIFHAAAVVIEFLQRVPPQSIIETDSGGKLYINEQHDYDSIVRLAYDEVRRCAQSSPTVGLYLLESLRLIRDSLVASGLPERAPEIERQARLVEEGVRIANHVEEDYTFISEARQERFGPITTAASYADVVKNENVKGNA